MMGCVGSLGWAVIDGVLYVRILAHIKAGDKLPWRRRQRARRRKGERSHVLPAPRARGA